MTPRCPPEPRASPSLIANTSQRRSPVPNDWSALGAHHTPQALAGVGTYTACSTSFLRDPAPIRRSHIVLSTAQLRDHTCPY